MRFAIFVICMLISANCYSQSRWIRLSGGGVLVNPRVSILEADPGFSIRNFSSGYRIGIVADQYFGSQNQWGIRTGINLVKKKYGVQFETTCFYEDDTTFRARLELEQEVQINYIVLELPLAVVYKFPVQESNSFFSAMAGVSVDRISGWSFTTLTHLELFNPQATPWRFNIQTSDDFAFGTDWSYSLFFGSSYAFLLRSQRYMEFGLSYHFSPVRLSSTEVTHTVNGKSFGASFRPEHLGYFQFFITYSLNRLEFNRYL